MKSKTTIAAAVLLTSLAIATPAYASDPGELTASATCHPATGTYTLSAGTESGYLETYASPTVTHAAYATADSTEAVDASDLVDMTEDATTLTARGFPGDAVEAYVAFDGVGNATALYADDLPGDCERVEADDDDAVDTPDAAVDSTPTPVADSANSAPAEDSVNVPLIATVLAVLAAIGAGTWAFFRRGIRTSERSAVTGEVVFTESRPRKSARAWVAAGFTDLPTTLSTIRDVAVAAAATFVVVGGIAVAATISVLVAMVSEVANSMGGGFGY